MSSDRGRTQKICEKVNWKIRMGKDMPKVSICIPTYNNADEVAHLLESIFEQDYTDFEVNISDDSTNDEIAKVVEQYQEKYQKNQIRYIHNEKGLGHIFNWNAAIRMATGEYIKIMFSDDWFTDCRSLGEFVRMLDENQDALLAFSGSRQVMLDGQNIEDVKHVTKDNTKPSYDRYASDEFIQRLQQDYRFLFCGNQIGAPSACIYRRGSSLTLFDEQSNWASDMYLYFDLLQKNAKFVYTKQPLISIGVHANQYTESFAERDMRIYNDYRYMYTKYHLQESEVCRAYFTESFLIKYHQSLKEAKVLGISSSMYWKKWLKEQKETLRCFLLARLGRKHS